jgi:hypothetical protein
MGGVLMADTLLQNLTELTSPATTDLLYMVADPSGTPLDRKVQFSTVLDRAKGYSTILDASGKGDYTVLATALAALSAGDVLFIRNGTYAGGVTVSTAGVTIIGETRNGVIIQSPANNSTPCFTISAANVTLQSLKIDGQRSTQGTGDSDTTTWSGIRVTAEGATIDNVWVFEPYGHGVSLAADDGRITNCLVENRATNGAAPTAGKYAYGIVVYGGSRWTIAYNRVTGFSQACGLWWGCSDNVVAFNKFIANYGYWNGQTTGTRSACEDYGSTNINYRNLWFGNLIDGATSGCIECAQGVVGSQYVSNVLKNANIFGDGGALLGVTAGNNPATEPTQDIVAQNNTMIGNGSSGSTSGLLLAPSGSMILSGNTLTNVKAGSTQAIQVESGNVTIRDNSLFNCEGGVLLSAGSHVVDGNRFMSPMTNVTSILVYSSLNIITNNLFNCQGSVYAQSIVANAAAHECQITGNIIQLAGGSIGIAVASDRNIVTHNVLETFWTCIAVSGDANTVRFNTLNSTYRAWAVNLESGATANIVTDNLLIASGTVKDDSANATNEIAPNSIPTRVSRTTPKSLGVQTVGATEATIAHTLGAAPVEIQIQMTSAGTIWKSAASDGTNIYLTADGAGRTAEVFVR